MQHNIHGVNLVLLDHYSLLTLHLPNWKTPKKQIPTKKLTARPPLASHNRPSPSIQRTINSQNTGKSFEKYGPILTLRCGSTPVLILSSSSALEELISKNDLIFANRPHSRFGKLLHYNSTTIATASYGDHWRKLRRITALEFLSTAKLNLFLGIRQEEVRSMLKNLSQISRKNFVKVELKSRLSELTYNIITQFVAGKRYFGNEAKDSVEATEFRHLISDILSCGFTPNPGDFVPLFNWFDFWNAKKRMLKTQKKMDMFFQGLIDENRRKDKEVSEEQNGGKTNSMINTMLELQDSDPQFYSDEIIKGQIVTILIGGTDTSTLTIEWAMSLLLNHPQVLEKARVELDIVVGENHLVDESDLSKLPYLQNIINETLRLFPPAPLLIPHKSSDDCTIEGHDVARGTMLMVNAWAIQRDPMVWEDPTCFMPERFEGGKNDLYKFIPFGVGRSCPGTGLANRVVGLALAALIQCFEWVRIGEELVDMSEGNGLTMPKSKPLKAMCKARKSMMNVLLEL